MSSTDLVVQNVELAPTTLFGTDNPAEVVERASGIAKTLEHVVRSQNLIVRIGQSEHVRVEGWTFLGSMLGVFPVVEWTRPVMREDIQIGWEARVEARTRSGEVVGAAEAECLTSENTWKNRDDYARRSMAQTRAVSKALRLPLGFVMQLAGFNPTPAEEMAVIDAEAVPRRDGDSAAGTPFSYGWEDVPQDGPPVQAPSVASSSPAPEGAPKPPSAAMLKKLNVLVGKLRPDHLSTLQLWQSMGRDPVASEDGLLHWSPLRDSLSWQEAHDLIDRLDRYAAEKVAA